MQSWREMASHELVSIGEKKTNSKSIILPRKPVTCSKHTKKRLKFYCDTCQCLHDLPRLHCNGAQRPQTSLS